MSVTVEQPLASCDRIIRITVICKPVNYYIIFCFYSPSRIPPPCHKQQLACNSYRVPGIDSSSKSISFSISSHLCDEVWLVELLSCKYTDAVAVHCQVSNSYLVYVQAARNVLFRSLYNRCVILAPSLSKLYISIM